MVHEVADGPRLVVEGVGSKALAVVVAHQKKSELLKSQGIKVFGLGITNNWPQVTLTIFSTSLSTRLSPVRDFLPLIFTPTFFFMTGAW